MPLSRAARGRIVGSAPRANQRTARWATSSIASSVTRNGMMRAGSCAYCPSDTRVYAPAVSMPAITTRDSSVDRRARARGDVVTMPPLTRQRRGRPRRGGVRRRSRCTAPGGGGGGAGHGRGGRRGGGRGRRGGGRGRGGGGGGRQLVLEELLGVAERRERWLALDAGDRAFVELLAGIEPGTFARRLPPQEAALLSLVHHHLALVVEGDEVAAAGVGGGDDET